MFSRLFDNLRESCRREDEEVWDSAVGFARILGLVTLESLSKRAIVLKVTLPTETMTRTVTLQLDDGEESWNCSCRGTEDVCVHAATAAIAFRLSVKDRRPLPKTSGALAHVEYVFGRVGECLGFARLLVHGAEKKILTTTLTALATGRGQGPRVEAESSDLTVDNFLKLENQGCLTKDRMVKLVQLLSECPKGRAFLGETPLTVSASPRHAVAVCLSEHFQGYVLRLRPTADVREVFLNGVATFQASEGAPLVLSPVANDVFNARERELLTRKEGWVFEAGRRVELLSSVVPDFRARGIAVIDRIRGGAAEMKDMMPHVDLRCASDAPGRLSVRPVIVYGEPPIAEVREGRLVPLGRRALPIRKSGAEARLTASVWNCLELKVGEETVFRDAASSVAASRRIRAWLSEAGSGSKEAHAGDRSLSALEKFRLSPPLRALFRTDGSDFVLEFETSSAGRRSGGRGLLRGKNSETPDGEGTQLQRAGAEAVFAAWKSGASVVPLLDGGYAEIPRQWLSLHGDRLSALFSARENEGKGKLPPCLLPELAAVCRELEAPVPPAFEEIEKCLTNFEGLPPLPESLGLNAALRGYQSECVRWLLFLKAEKERLGGGALLADDMGLGKTLETIAVLEGPSLVVAPTSVIFNWRSELSKFRPDLKVSLYYGLERKLSDEADVVVTSYALMRRDLGILKERHWKVLVLDEAQAIKTPTSQTALSAFDLGKSADFRLALTGTPVENRLDELWSEMNFACPGLLGARSAFDERYARPIQDGDEAAASSLRGRIRPFVLRRVKEDVAVELPPKTETVMKVELSEGEMALYQAIRALLEKQISLGEDAGESGGNASGSGNVMDVLAGLTRLRQACCHPRLLPGELGRTASLGTGSPNAAHPMESSKVNLLAQKLLDLRDGGHRALVFSQWTSLLDLVGESLRAVGVSFTRLDGSTQDRQAVVSDFQRPDGPTAMLVSLKAGGTGLNLTAADHVFLLDPWWNPAAEAQAADRTHRIGQEKPVFVHRMVAMDTVEERILELQESKRALAEAALSGSSSAASLTREDLFALLRP